MQELSNCSTSYILQRWGNSHNKKQREINWESIQKKLLMISKSYNLNANAYSRSPRYEYNLITNSGLKNVKYLSNCVILDAVGQGWNVHSFVDFLDVDSFYENN